jgi:outer membrane receptor protein involved in Fe transport
VLLATALLVSPALAQFSSRLQGTATDPNGAVVSNAGISLTNTQSHQEFHTSTNSSGQYHFESLAPGDYILRVIAPGYATKEITTTLTTQQIAGVDVKLAIASASSTVQVTTQAAALNVEETRVQSTLSNKQMQELPLQNRGTLNIVNAAPGVSGFTYNQDNFANELTPNASANGHFSGSNLYVIDGISSTSNVTGGTNNVTPNPDSLQEIALQTNTFSPEYSGGSGVTIEMTTRAGSTKFHGGGEFSFYNQDLEARSYFVQNVEPFKLLEYSGVLGGPIWKDRSFFFASVEKKSATDPAGTNFFATEDPSLPAFLQSKYPATKGTALIAKYPTKNVSFLGVKYYTSADLMQQCIVPSGACSIPLIDNASQRAAPFDNGLQYSFRVDQLFRQGKDRIYGYFFHIDHDVQSIDPRPAFSTVGSTTSALYSANYTHVFSPNLLNQASFSYDSVDGIAGSGMPSVPIIAINNATTINGFGGGFGPGTFIQHNYSWRDVVTYVRGKHDFKFGFEAAYANDSADFSGINARPTFQFNSISDFVNDKVFSENDISYNPLTGKFKPLQFGVGGRNYGIFFQDSWKLTPRLQLNLGIRWDSFGNPGAYGYSSYTKIANLIPAGHTSLLPGLGMDPQFANASIRTSQNVYNQALAGNIAPRIGFAFSPTSSGDTSIHGGVGLYYDQITLGQIIDQLRGNPPGWIYPTFGEQQAIPAIYSIGTTDTYPYGFTYPAIPATGLDSHGGIPGANASVQGINPGATTPTTVNYTLAASHQFAANVVAEMIYAGSYSWNQLTATDFNRSAGDLIRNDGQLHRLNPSFGSITYAGNFDLGNYNSVIFSLRQHIGKLDYQASYTWSHALDYGTCDTRYLFNAPIGPQAHSVDCAPDQHFIGVRYYGNSSFDEPNNFKLTGSWELPSPERRLLKPMLGGWQVTSLVVFQSGVPFTAANESDYDPTCLTANADNPVQCGDYNADGYDQDLPNVVTNQRGGGFTKKQFINGVFRKDASGRTTAFAAPTPGTEGNESRNSFRNPRLFNLDASVLKNFIIPWIGLEKATLQLRVDAFNAPNHTNLQPIDYNIGDSTFGQSLSTYQPRIIQLGARFHF